MTNPSPSAQSRTESDGLVSEERVLQRALGIDGPPPPRLNDAAFLARVSDRRRRPSHRWALTSIPLLGTAVFGLVIGLSDPAPPAASGAELYALTLDALEEDDRLLASAFDALLDDGDRDHDDEFADSDVDDDVDIDTSLSAAVSTWTAGGELASLNDDDLVFLDHLFDTEATD